MAPGSGGPKLNGFSGITGGGNVKPAETVAGGGGVGAGSGTGLGNSNFGRSSKGCDNNLSKLGNSNAGLSVLCVSAVVGASSFGFSID